jgi:hypothetical protein
MILVISIILELDNVNQKCQDDHYKRTRTQKYCNRKKFTNFFLVHYISTKISIYTLWSFKKYNENQRVI